MPKSAPRQASTSGPAHICQGASRGLCPAGTLLRQNGRNATTPATANISAFDKSTAPATSKGSEATARAPAYFNSLPIKPRKGGNPAMENAASAAEKAVTGINRPNP